MGCVVGKGERNENEEREEEVFSLLRQDRRSRLGENLRGEERKKESIRLWKKKIQESLGKELVLENGYHKGKIRKYRKVSISASPCLERNAIPIFIGKAVLSVGLCCIIH
jgi:hypothetical protein